MLQAYQAKLKNRYLLDILARRDNHMDRVASYTEILLDQLGAAGCQEFNSKHKDLMIVAARLHDVGKLMVDENLIYSPCRLTGFDLAKIRCHPIQGAKLLDELFCQEDDPILRDYAIKAALFHHERWDGQGYPYGLAGTNIPFVARVIALADVYDALRVKRVYKEALTHLHVTCMINQEIGKAFDPRVVTAFQMQNAAMEKLSHEKNM